MNKLDYFTEFVLNNPGEGHHLKAFNKYQEYISENESKLPPFVVNLVRSQFYFNFTDPRCPKDGWVMSKHLDNKYDAEGRKKISSKFEIKLLGAYHDCYLHFVYTDVIELEDEGSAGCLIQKDYDPWRIDEFSVDSEGNLVHKIYFLSGIVWTIKCRNFDFIVREI